MKGRVSRLVSKLLPKEESLRIIHKIIGYDGGPGSGNFGHKGRPGKVGGSAKEETGQSTGSEKLTTASSPIDEPFDFWEFTEEESKEQERRDAEAAQKAFEKLSESYHMKGIVDAAKAHKGDYKGFVKAMTPGQRDALRVQHRASGSKEYFPDYVKRMQKMLTEVEDVPDPENKVVDGKDITGTYTYMGKESSDKAGTEEIDTEIEDVLHQQGFDGVPKVVPKEEFDKIAEEHPEMPILIRAFTAENAETLQKYNDDLERGFFYVDCGTGGADYGQGMYCAGVYREPNDDHTVRKWDDPDLDTDSDIFVFKDESGQAYKTQEEDVDRLENNDDLYIDTVYMCVDKDGNRRLIKRDADSLMWEDVSKYPQLIRDEEVDGMIDEAKHGGALFMCDETDPSIYEEAEKRDAENAVKSAESEADHYLRVGINRIMEDGPSNVPEGKAAIMNWSDESAFYYDPKCFKSAERFTPEDGTVVALKGENYYPSLYSFYDGVFRNLETGSQLRIEDANEYVWAPIEGRIDTFTPQGTVRKMTLDPSAKIITLDEIRDIKEGRIPRSVERKSTLDHFDEMSASMKQELSDDEMYYMRNLYMDQCGYTSFVVSPRHERIGRKLSEDEKLVLETMAKSIKDSLYKSKIFDLEQKYRKKAYVEYAKFRNIGAFAAALGYDAINAHGHGQSMSYTVVLNRTKVILQKEAM